MTWIALLLIVIAGIAEHFKDLSEEGKLEGYWDKNHPPNYYACDETCGCGWFEKTHHKDWYSARAWTNQKKDWLKAEALWWKVHWLQGPKWDWIPVWIRQYLSFRDGWHLLKFVSLNFFALGVVILFSVKWWWFIVLRFAFSSPETILRKLKIYNKI
jgi:hypothetical protein